MDQPTLPRPGQPLDTPSRPPRHPPSRRWRVPWRALSAALLAAAIVPGCLSRGADPEGADDEDVAETEEAITAGTNLAQGKTATQSTTAWGGVASRAVDGNTDGHWLHESVTHTDLELSPWWQVDLGAPQLVGTIELHNRTDWAADRLSNFKLLVSDDAVNWQSWDYPGSVGARVSFGVNRTARYVKVQLNSTGTARPFSLAEVKVFAPPNLALGKLVFSSSTGWGGLATRAIDGNTNGDFGAGSVTHTLGELSPFWQIDLGSPLNVGRVELYNRTDCCSDRLGNFKLLVSNDGQSWQPAATYPGVAGPKTILDLSRAARFVRVQLENTGVVRYLSLAEVAIYPAPNASPQSSLPSSSPLGATAPVGSLDGQFDVDAQGAATYSIPIKVPPGTNGVEPKLSLAYRSAGGNGFVGMGWGLTGISQITRCARTMAQDGVRGSLNGDAGDRFCLDGKRLIAVSGVDGADGTQYRTELESFSRVFSYGTCGTGPCRFEVTDKSGNKAIFGGTADSRPMIGATARAFGLNRLTSRHGNYLTVTYQSEGGQILPQQILYTMNDAVPSLKKRRVAFSYEGRTDPEVRYFAGYKMYANSKRLASVKTYVEGASGEVPVRDYRLIYDSSAATGRSLLTSIAECDGQGVCLPATQLDYLSAPSADGDRFTIHWPQGAEFQEWLQYDPGATLLAGDFNGDGRSDFLRQERKEWGTDISNNLMVYFSTGAGTFNRVMASCVVNGEDLCQVLTGQEYGAYLFPADIDGDGLCDFYRQERGGWGGTPGRDLEAYLSNGDGTFRPYSVTQSGLSYDGGGPSDPGSYLTLGDFAGDGGTDVFGQARGLDFGLFWGARWHLALGQWNGNGFTMSSPPVNAGGLDWFAEAMAHDQGAYLYTGDFNGDGITDLLRQEHGEWNPDDQHNLQIYFSRGGGQFTLVEPHDYQPNGVDLIQNDFNYDQGAFIYPGDFNGDGMTDILRIEHGDWGTADNLHTFRVYFSNGAGGFDMVEPSGDKYQVDLKGDSNEITLIDYNGDRKTDFIRRGKDPQWGSFSIYVSRGDGTFDVVVPWAADDHDWDWYQKDTRFTKANIIPGDYDGDGKTDFLRQKLGGFDDETYRTFQVFAANGDDAVDSLKKVTNGLGGTVDVQYAPLTDGAVYTKGTGATGSLTDVQSPMYVVKSYQSGNGAGQSFGYTYAYAGARADRAGRGFLGFSKITRTSASTGAVTTHEYNQWPFQLTGTVKSRTLRSADGTASVRTDYTYGTSLSYPGVHVTVPTREEATHKEGANSYKTVKEYEYDAWGNLTIQHDRGLDGDASDDVDTCTAYSGSDAVSVWWLDYPTYTRVAQSCSMVNGLCQCAGVMSTIDRYYDWGTMNVTAVYELDDRYGRWPSALFTYDALGNVLTRSLPGASTPIVEKNTYDPDYRTFPIAQTKTGGNLAFTTTSTFDPRFGTLVSQTDANGNTTASTLDGLGRVVERSETSPDGYPVQTARVTYGSDAYGRFRRTDTLTDWQSGATRWQLEHLDGHGRTRRVSVQSDTANPILTDRTFDEAGQVASETVPYFQGAAPVWQTFTRDWLGRVVETTDANGSLTKVVYGVDTAACALCAVKISTTEAFGTPLQRTWIRHDDVLDNARRQVDPDNRVTTFGYDRLERRTSVGDAAGTTTTAYDSLNRVTSVTSPDRGTLTNEYGASDWLSSTTDANGVVTTFTYDDLGRLSQKAVTNGEITMFSYDNPAYANGLGRLTTVRVFAYPGQQTPTSSNDFAYTPSGAIAVNAMTIDGHAYTLSSTYDPEGRLLTLTYPDGSVLSRSYSALGTVKSLTMGGKVHAQYDLFSELGKPGKVTYYNGTQTTFAYDVAGRLTASATKGPGNTNLLGYTYTWDRLHRITRVEDLLVGARTQDLTYSASGQLVAASASVYGSLAYTYDAAGNLTSKEGASYTYTNHRVTGGDGFTAAYDAAGNRTSQTRGGVTTQYQYGAENRMTQVTKAGSVVEQYAYDFSGERVKKIDGTGANAITTLYVTPAFEVTYFPGGRRVETKYVNGPSGRVAAVSKEFAAGAAAILDARGIDSASRLFDKGSLAGLLGYVAVRARALRAHPDAPVWGEIALGLAAFAAVLAIARRRAPHRVAAIVRALRAAALPRKTAFVRRHPVFAFVVPIVAAAFLSACTRAPGAEGTAGHTEEALVAGANGEGYPVDGTYYFHQDHVGSSSVITDKDGLEVARTVYKPYGEIVQAASPGLDIFRSKFSGKEWDKDAGLYYFNARSYDPLTGRFMSADSQVQGGAQRDSASINPYSYANNSPVLYSDPSGRFFFIAIIVLAVVMGAYAGGMNANGGSLNPASWNWSSWTTYAGIGVGGLVGGLSAGVGIGVGGFAGVLASSLLSSVAMNGLKFLSPQGSTLEELGIGIATDLATSALTGGLKAGPRNELGKTFTARLAAKIAQKATLSRVAKLLGSTALKAGRPVGMAAAKDNDVDSADGIMDRMGVSSRSRPPEPPPRVDFNQVSAFVTSMGDALLGASGADDVPGRSTKDFRSRRWRPAIAPALAMSH